jgi:ferritin-like protein
MVASAELSSEARQDQHLKSSVASRRSFMKKSLVAGAVAAGAGVLSKLPSASAKSTTSSLNSGDVAILQFLAAAEIIESDLWLQYQELGGIQDDEVAKLASKLIPGYPAKATGGNPLYMNDLVPLDEDMSQYIHDNTEDELTHEVFINKYLESKGAPMVSLDQFRTLPSSKATGANQFGRLTNLMQLTVDTSWWTRYRSRHKNPDFGDTFPQAVQSLAVGQHPAIPRTDDDANDQNFFQAIVNTAGFHFAFIEQGGTSLYPQLAQRVTNAEVLRILLSIGGVEIAHFQTWQDKAGNAPVLDAVDPVTGIKISFPDLNSSPLGGEDFQTNLIMPEPTVFLSRHLPPCSIIRPTATKGAAMGALESLTADGLFIGQSSAFYEFMHDLAENADAVKREQ